MSINYYNPDPRLVDFLQQKLRSNQVARSRFNADERDSMLHQTKQINNRINRKKSYNMDSIFKSFTDVLYFLEFIRDNYEDLGETFENDLKDLFGYNKYYTQDEFQSNPAAFQEGHYKNPAGPLQRLVDAIVLRDPTRPNYNKESLDFRTVIIADIFIYTSIVELAQRFTQNDEHDMMVNDSKRFRFWANFLAKQVQDGSKNANRRIGYVPYKIDMDDLK